MADMADRLYNADVLRAERAREAFRTIDRADFVADRATAYQDTPQALPAYNTTVTAPHMHAHVLNLLETHLVRGARMLDIGCGTGYLTCALAKMVTPGGSVVGVDHIPELVAWAGRNAATYCADAVAAGELRLVVGDGYAGYPAGAPYDVIHLGAAPPRVPPELVRQLAVGGVLLGPIGPAGDQTFRLITRTDDTHYSDRELFGVRYVPLTTYAAQMGRVAGGGAGGGGGTGGGAGGSGGGGGSGDASGSSSSAAAAPPPPPPTVDDR